MCCLLLYGCFFVPCMVRTPRYSKLRYSAYSMFLVNRGERVIPSDRSPTASINVRGRLGVKYTLLFGYTYECG